MERTMARPIGTGAPWRPAFVLLLVLVLSVCLGACAAQGPPKPVSFGADITVSAGLNPDSNGRPSPMILGVYQLKSPDKFSNGDFFSVFDPEGTALGDDLVRREQITLQPGTDRSFETELEPQASFLGIVGAFSDIESAQWRSVVEIPEKNLLKRVNVFKRERLKIVVTERAVDVAFSDG
jgi:type VI secretion system protein VasD